MTDLLLLALAMLATGAIGGVLAGLLGIGGGIVIVPVLDAALQFLGTEPSIRMHVAVATSLATAELPILALILTKKFLPIIMGSISG